MQTCKLVLNKQNFKPSQPVSTIVFKKEQMHTTQSASSGIFIVFSIYLLFYFSQQYHIAIFDLSILIHSFINFYLASTIINKPEMDSDLEVKILGQSGGVQTLNGKKPDLIFCHDQDYDQQI